MSVKLFPVKVRFNIFSFIFQDFLLKARRKDAKSVKIKKNAENVKFKVRFTSKFYTVVKLLNFVMILYHAPLLHNIVLEDYGPITDIGFISKDIWTVKHDCNKMFHFRLDALGFCIHL